MERPYVVACEGSANLPACGMSKCKTAIVVSASFALAFTDPASGAATLPTGKWVVDYKEQACVATREYGNAAKPLYLGLKPSPMGGVMQLSIIRNLKGDSAAVEETGSVSFDHGKKTPVSMLSFGSSNGVYSTRINLPVEKVVVMRTAGSLRIHGPSIDETLVLQQLPQLMQQIDACVTDLQDAWNMLPNGSAKVKTRAKGTMLDLFKMSDYPETSLSKAEQGSVKVVFLINELGKVADCVVTETSGVAALDLQTCAVISHRATFKPAVGLDGMPTRDSYSQSIHWKN